MASRHLDEAKCTPLRQLSFTPPWTNPDEMFSLDRFHPSALGYKRTAKAIAPSVLAALGVRGDVPFGHHAPAQVETEAQRP